MSKASDLKEAVEVYEVTGKSGRSYLFFFFRQDHSTCQAVRVKANSAVTKLDFGIRMTKDALKDCGIEGEAKDNTYQYGWKLRDQLKQLELGNRGA